MKRTRAGQRLIDELDAELAASAAAAGRTLSWSVAERAVIAMTADATDRRADLAAAYDAVDEVGDRIKLSPEMRLAGERGGAAAGQDQHCGAGAGIVDVDQGPPCRQYQVASCRLITRASATGAYRARMCG